MADKYEGSPPEISDIPVFDIVQFLVWPDCRPYPGWSNQQVEARGSIWEFCTKKITGPVWAEFGVMLGTSARYFLRKLPIHGKFYLFDSFEGIPEPWAGNPKGHFAVKGHAIPIPNFHDARTKVIEGWFEDVLPINEVFDFIHIDSDLYSSAKTILELSKVRLGTIILFDEFYGFKEWKEGEYKALMEWDRPYKFIARDKYQRVAIEVL